MNEIKKCKTCGKDFVVVVGENENETECRPCRVQWED